MVTFFLGSGQVPSCPVLSCDVHHGAPARTRAEEGTCTAPRHHVPAAARHEHRLSPGGSGTPLASSDGQAPVPGAVISCAARTHYCVCACPAWCGVGWNGLLALHAPCAMFRNYSLYLRCRGFSGHASFIRVPLAVSVNQLCWNPFSLNSPSVVLAPCFFLSIFK